MSNILDFIQQFREYDSVEDAFRYGHCYYFALTTVTSCSARMANTTISQAKQFRHTER